MKDERYPYQGPVTPITRHEVEGWRYELLSMNAVHLIRFDPGGYAASTIGSGDTLAAPSYRWKISDDGCLVLSDDKGPFAVYQLISIKSDRVILWDQKTGRSSVFGRERPPP